MDWLRLGLILLVIVGSIEAQQGYNYPKPETPFSDSAQPSSHGGSSISSLPSAQPASPSQIPFGTQQPSSAQPGVPSKSQQPSTGYPGSEQTGSPAQAPFGTQQPSGGYSSGSQPGYSSSGQPGAQSGRQRPFGGQKSSGYPSGEQPESPSGGQGPFGTQQPSGYPSGTQPGTPTGSQRPFESQKPSGYPSGEQPELASGGQGQFGTQQPSGYPSGTQPGTPSSQRPFGTQQPSGYPSESQPGEPSGSQQPFGGYSSSGRPGTPTATSRPFDAQQPSGSYPSTAQSGTPSGTQQSFLGHTGAGTPSGTPGTFGSQQPTEGYSGGAQPGPASGTQQPFGSYPGSGQTGTPSGTTGPFGAQQPSGSYSGSTQPGAQRPFASQQPGYKGSVDVDRREPSFGTRKPEIDGQIDTQQRDYPGSDVSSRTQGPSTGRQQGSFPGQIQPGSDVPSRTQGPSTGRQQGSFPGQTQPGYSYPAPQGSSVGATQPVGSRPGVSESTTLNFGQRPAGERLFGETGTTSTPQFPSGEEKPYGSYPTPSQGQFPVASFRSSGTAQTQSGQPQGSIPFSETYPGTESRYPTGGAGQQISRGKQGRDKFSGEERPAGQFPSGQVDRSGSEVPSTRQFSSGGATQPSGLFGEQETSRRPEGHSQAGRPTQPQLPSNGFTQTAESERPGFSTTPTGRVNGYSGATTQQGSPDARPRTAQRQFPSSSSSAPQGKQGSTRYPENEQRPLSSYLPPGDRGTGDLPLSATPASQFPSVGSRTPTTSRFPSGRSEEPARSGNSVGVSTSQPTGGASIDGQPEQPIRSQNGYTVPGALAGRIPSGGRQFGSQFPSGDRPQQDTNGYSRSGEPSTPQQFGRPGATGRALDGPQDGFSRRTGSQGFPESSQAPRDFVPGQQIPSDEDSGSDGDEGDYSAIPGQPGRDYPILSEVPETSFSCDDQEYRGYYADVETRCQIFHICANNKTYDFLCPNGTVFHQEHLVCVWWNQFDCDTAPSLYRINENIYDYTVFGAQQTGGIPVPGQDYPESAEDFPGTIVDGQGRQRPGSEFDGVGRPGGYPSGPHTFTGPSTSGRRPITGIQGPGGYPTRRPQESIGVQGSEEYPSGGLEISGSGDQRPGEYPSGRPQGSTGRFPSVTSQGTGQYPSGGLERPGSDAQRAGEYPSGKPQGSTGRFPSVTSQGKEQYPSGGLQRPGSGSKRPAGYPTERPQGSTGGYSDVTSPETQGYPSGGLQRPGTGVQTPGGYQTTSTGYSSSKPQGVRPNQFPGGASQIPSGGTQGFEGYTGPGGSQISTPGQRPKQFRGEGVSSLGSVDVSQQGGYPSQGPQDTGFPSGPGARPAVPGKQTAPQYGVPEVSTSQTQDSGRPHGTDFPSGPGARPVGPGRYTPPQYGVPEASTSQTERPEIGAPSEYPTGTTVGFPSVSQPSGPSGPGSLFPGSPQPHQPTREYLPSV